MPLGQVRRNSYNSYFALSLIHYYAGYNSSQLAYVYHKIREILQIIKRKD